MPSEHFVVGKPGGQARAPAVVAVRYWKLMDEYQWVVCVHADWSTSLHGFRAKPFLFYAAKKRIVLPSIGRAVARRAAGSARASDA